MRPLLILQTDRTRGPGFVGDFLARAGRPAIIVQLDRLRLAPARKLLAGCAGLIVLDDGTAGENDACSGEYVDELLRTAQQSGLIVCGVGSGARLLATSLGASASAEPSIEIGWFATSLKPQAAAGPWLTRLGSTARTVFLCHRHALAVPPDCIALLAGPQSPCVTFAGERVLGLHFHADLTPAGFAQWLPAVLETLPQPAATVQTAAEIAGGLPHHAAGMRDFASRLLTHWLSGLDD